MKKVLIGISLMCVFTLAGCEKFLDEPPQSELTNDKFWQSADDINAGMAGIYDAVQKMYSSNFIVWGDGRTDNLRLGGNGERDYPFNELDSQTGGSDWTPVYTAIARVNTAIKYIPTVKNVNPNVINDALSQCYAVRAYCYFVLVRLWGDVPVWTEPYENLGDSPYRSRTNADVVINETIIPDLKKALELSQSTNSNVFQANLGAIYSIFTDVYMWKRDYANALDYSNRLLALNRYSLVSTGNWKLLFVDPASSNNRESIWSLDWTWENDGGVGIAEQIGAGNTSSDFAASDDIWNYWTTNTSDVRGSQTLDFAVTQRDKMPKFYPTNIVNGRQVYPADNQASAKFPLYRLADILLLRAEALNKTGNKPGALTLLNQVRKRANPAAKDLTLAELPDESSIENAILRERQLELYLESKRWYDLVRTGKVLEVMDPVLRERQTQAGSPVIGFGSAEKILWPINISNLNSNPLLVQNPGYGS